MVILTDAKDLPLAGDTDTSLTLAATSYVKFCRLGRFVFVMLPSV
jgi:hypothetical protein